MLKKINHIGVVVEDLERALESYSKGLGVMVEKIVEIADVELKVGIINVGDVQIELLEYNNPELPIVRALLGDRTGFNHICYEVEDFDGAIRQLRQNGFEVVEGFPRKGVHGTIAFLVPPHSSAERIEILIREGAYHESK